MTDTPQPDSDEVGELAVRPAFWKAIHPYVVKYGIPWVPDNLCAMQLIDDLEELAERLIECERLKAQLLELEVAATLVSRQKVKPYMARIYKLKGELAKQGEEK